MIVGEPTESRLISRQKGILKAQLVSKGVAAHSGYPHLGVSAIDKLVQVLADLQKVCPCELTGFFFFFFFFFFL